MSTASPTAEIRTALASAAKSYEPSRRVRFNRLAPFKEEIRDLRSRGAAFATIAEILRKHSVKVSHETVRRFFREAIEEKPRRRRRSRNANRATSQSSHKRPRESNNGDSPRPSATRTERGPRIARIEDL